MTLGSCIMAGKGDRLKAALETFEKATNPEITNVIQTYEELFDIGFKNLDALDASSQMLEVAKQKNIYKRIICDYLGPSRLDIEDDTYNLIMCIGSLLPTHINEKAFDEMIRITKPGGYVVFQVGLHAIGKGKAQIETCMQTLHKNGKWMWIINRTLTNTYENITKVEDGSKGLLYVFRVLPQ